MADKKKPTVKIEREYIVNLRKEIIKAPRQKKAKKAIRALKAFLSRHMKSEDVKLGKYLNEYLWQNGPKNPPTRVEIRVTKKDEKVFAELKSAPEEKKKDKKEKKKIIEKKEIEKEKQVDMSLVDKQKKVAKEKKKEEVPKAAELKEEKK
ncbi:MAG: 50S ribosomal protein L31e [Nanoarchaeota archaeon]|nr:50S ribosomal protein L31e [Nanoarchaeota archaeon]